MIVQNIHLQRCNCALFFCIPFDKNTVLHKQNQAVYDTSIDRRKTSAFSKRIANRAKITQEVTPHVLRHTFATLALQQNISLAAVQKILGRYRLTTTAIYLNLTDMYIVEEYAQQW